MIADHLLCDFTFVEGRDCCAWYVCLSRKLLEVQLRYLDDEMFRQLKSARRAGISEGPARHDVVWMRRVYGDTVGGELIGGSGT